MNIPRNWTQVDDEKKTEDVGHRQDDPSTEQVRRDKIGGPFILMSQWRQAKCREPRVGQIFTGKETDDDPQIDFSFRKTTSGTCDLDRNGVGDV